MNGVKTIIKLLGELAMYKALKLNPRRTDTPIRIALVLPSRLLNRKAALLVVQPRRSIQWHRQDFRLFWRWKSRPGCPRIPAELGQLIQEMAVGNPSWGEERIANELLLKPGIRISPRTVRKYIPIILRGHPRQEQSWWAFVRNHASVIMACNFCAVVTATFRLHYVFTVIKRRTRRIVHCNVITNPTAVWTLPLLREAIHCDHRYRFPIHDRDNIFSLPLDQPISHMGLGVLRTPPRSPKANSLFESVIGRLRRECLDFFIPFTETHLRCITINRVAHYNTGRPRSNISPGIPDPSPDLPVSSQIYRQRIPNHLKFIQHPVPGGLGHGYGRLPKAA